MIANISSQDGLENTRQCRVFISYAHEQDDHRRQVRDFWMFLRSHGIDARLDLPAAEQRQDWALWMANEIREADHILVIASPAYRERAQGQSGPDAGRGVQWEGRLIRDAFYRDQQTLNRFLPVVLPGQSVADVPDFLAGATSTVYHVRAFTVAEAEPLLRLLTRQPSYVEPPLGPQPVLESYEPAPARPDETTTRTRATASDRSRRPRWLIPLAAVSAAATVTASVWFGITDTSGNVQAPPPANGGAHSSQSRSGILTLTSTADPAQSTTYPRQMPYQPGPSQFATAVPTIAPQPGRVQRSTIQNQQGTPAKSAAATDTIRYSGSFQLDASHEMYDLDQLPPQVYGPVNTLAVGDNSIDVVVPNGAKAAYWTAQQTPAQKQCQDAVAQTNPSVDSFPAPQPGLVFCVMTYGGRYGFVQVNTTAPKNYNVTATIWEK